MPAFSTLHNELRLRVPNKPYEFYDNAIRWAVNELCRKTSMWQVITELTTQAGVSVYDIDLPVDSAIHSNLYIVQKGTTPATDRYITRPVNGFAARMLGGAPADYLQAFETESESEIKIYPEPKNGGANLEIHTSIKPTTKAVSADNDKLFDEYKDTIIYGAMICCLEADKSPLDYESISYNSGQFKIGVSSIKADVIKQNANTPFKISARW